MINKIKSQTDISFVIPTKDRLEILEINLNSLVVHLAKAAFTYEVVVLDSDCDTKVQSLCGISSIDVKYVAMPNVGVCSMRNHGAAIASGEWLCFLDDDLYVDATFSVALAKVMHNTRYMMVGGNYKSWFYYGRPVWLSEHYGSELYSADDGIKPMGDSSPHAGILMIKKMALEAVGGWNTKLGPTVKAMKYGEENYLMQSLLQKGYEVGRYSRLMVYHLVDKRKLYVTWHLRAEFRRARDRYFLSPYKVSDLAYEILIVDNGSKDDVQSVAEKYNCRYLSYTKTKSPYAARNKGVKAAKYDILLLMDAKCRPVPGYGEALAEVLLMDTWDIVGGDVLPKLPAKVDSIFSVAYAVLFLKVAPKYHNGIATALTGNALYRKEVFDKIGYFKPVAMHEDVDFVNRCRRVGCIVHYSPSLQVSYRVKTKNEFFTFLKGYSKGRSVGLLSLRPPNPFRVHARLRDIDVSISPYAWLRLFGALWYVRVYVYINK